MSKPVEPESGAWAVRCSFCGRPAAYSARFVDRRRPAMTVVMSCERPWHQARAVALIARLRWGWAARLYWWLRSSKGER